MIRVVSGPRSQVASLPAQLKPRTTPAAFAFKVVVSGFSRTILARLLALACLTVLGTIGAASAQDVHLLVVTGVGGDEEHTAQFQKWAGAVVDSAKKHGVLEANVHWLGEAPRSGKKRV